MCFQSLKPMKLRCEQSNIHHVRFCHLSVGNCNSLCWLFTMDPYLTWTSSSNWIARVMHRYTYACAPRASRRARGKFRNGEVRSRWCRDMSRILLSNRSLACCCLLSCEASIGHRDGTMSGTWPCRKVSQEWVTPRFNDPPPRSNIPRNEWLPVKLETHPWEKNGCLLTICNFINLWVWLRSQVCVL